MTSVHPLLYDKPLVLIFALLLGSLLVAGEVGYRIGRRRRPSTPEPARDQASSILGAILGLFALLIGFTFAMSLSRFDARRQIVVREANAIGTALLRAGLLPPDQRVFVTECFRRYVDNRISKVSISTLRTAERQALDAEAARLQEELWSRALANAAADPQSVSAGQFVQAVNDLIDLKGEHDAVRLNRVPESVLVLLLAFALLTSSMLGYASGLAGVRAFGAAAVLFLLVTLVILVILDLDRPTRGLIKTGLGSMVTLQESLKAE